MENRGVPGLKRKFVITSVYAWESMHGWPFFYDERGHRTTEAIQLLRDKKEWLLECNAKKRIEK